MADHGKSGAGSLEAPSWDDLPAPVDDGAAAHLPGLAMPSVALPATTGEPVDLAALGGRTIVYIYPRTGQPVQALPTGWDGIPGARGCTPQSCSFRDHAQDLAALGAAHLFGLSTQDSDYQREAAERMHLPFPLISDADGALGDALRLPRFEVEGMVLLKRLTLVIDAGRITHAFYPVFPPDQNAADVMAWLRDNPL